ncbi:hypothetical protein [Galbibacter sp.]|uniref:hypothetical protein n=1 Tax=Galbibacter sp. TaxID=2918471 RepID=UPI003A8E1F82
MSVHKSDHGVPRTIKKLLLTIWSGLMPSLKKRQEKYTVDFTNQPFGGLTVKL